MQSIGQGFEPKSPVRAGEDEAQDEAQDAPMRKPNSLFSKKLPPGGFFVVRPAGRTHREIELNFTELESRKGKEAAEAFFT